jgi:hypothetical protein
MAPGTLSRRLLKHGIEARSTRNPALLALAAELPAPILANLLGMHVSTASRLAAYAKRDWNAHLAARVKEHGMKSLPEDEGGSPLLLKRHGDGPLWDPSACVS